MKQIQPHALWVGHAGEAGDLRRLFETGIEALVHLAAEELPPPTPREVVACHFPLVDGPGTPPALLGLAVRTVASLVVLRMPTLISCGGGVSRSPAVAAAALALAHGTPVEECLRLVAACHPSDVSPGLWAELTAILPSLRRP